MKQTTVRPAQASDIKALMRMAESFHAASPCNGLIEFDPVSMANTFRTLATEPRACLLVAEVDGDVCAMVAGVLAGHYVNESHLVAQELFWWADEEARGSSAGPRLLSAFEDWARDEGASTVIMASTSTLTPEKLARYYERKGYRPVDVNYAKNLEV